MTDLLPSPETVPSPSEAPSHARLESRFRMATVDYSSPSDSNPDCIRTVSELTEYEIATDVTIPSREGRKSVILKGVYEGFFPLKQIMDPPIPEIFAALSKIQHPCVHHYAEAISPDLPGLLLLQPFQTGGSLDQLLPSFFEGRKPSFWTNPRITIQLLDVAFGLTYLHLHGLYHGNLSPSNIFIDDSLLIKGHMRVDSTSSLYFRGDRSSHSPDYWSRYAAPELLTGGELGPWTDVYSYGAFLYEVLALKPISEFPQIPATIDPRIATIIGQCLSIDCASRPSIEAVFDAIVQTGPEPFVPNVFTKDEMLDVWIELVQMDKWTRKPDDVIGYRLMRAARLGDAVAQWQAGVIIANGFSCHPNAEASVALFGASADSKNPWGLFFHAEIVAGLSDSLELATTIYRTAADLGHLESMFCCGSGFEKLNELTLAAEYYQKAADLGHPRAMNDYGKCLLKGLGVGKDVSLAVRYFKMSADREDRDGMLNYGLCLSQGTGVDQNWDLAAPYFQCSARKWNTDATYNWGLCLEYGRGVAQDLEAAADCYRRAQTFDHLDARYFFGICCVKGRGVERDFKRGLGYFRRAADAGHPASMCMLGLILSNILGAGPEVFLDVGRRYKLAAEQGWSQGMHSYACFLVEHPDLFGDSPERYFKMAADTGDCFYAWVYARRLRLGLDVEQNEEEALRYFAEVESSTNAGNLADLADKLWNGWDLPLDIPEAVRIYRRAADLGSLRSLEVLALCYENGIGVAQDHQEALRLYQLAADRGSRDAWLTLGLYHWRGMGGVPVDREEAIRLWGRGRLKGAEVILNPDNLIPSAPVSEENPPLRLSEPSDARELDTEERDGRLEVDDHVGERESRSDDQMRADDSDEPEPEPDHRMRQFAYADESPEVGSARGFIGSEIAPDSPPEVVPITNSQSFGLWNDTHSPRIESVVTQDNVPSGIS